MTKKLDELRPDQPKGMPREIKMPEGHPLRSRVGAAEAQNPTGMEIPEKLRRTYGVGYGQSTVEDRRLEVRRLLDALYDAMTLDPTLRTEFYRHAVGKELISPRVHEQLDDTLRLAAAPIYWRDRRQHRALAETDPVRFIIAVYGPDGSDRLGKGFTQADLKKVDPSLYNAFQRVPPEEIPEGFDLPTLEEWNRRQLDAARLTPLVDDPKFRNVLIIAASRANRQHRPR